MFFDIRAGRERPITPENPKLTSSNAPWRGIRVEQFNYPPQDNQDVFCLNHLIFIHLQGEVQLDYKSGEVQQRTQLQPGDVTFLPAKHVYSATVHNPGECLAVSLSPQFVTCAAQEVAPADRIDFIPQWGIEEPLLNALGFALKQEVESGNPGGRSYGEALGAAMALQLVRRFSGAPAASRELKGGLARYQLQKAIDYLEANLKENISLTTLADVVGMSPFHFARAFKKSTGLPPHKYIIRSRVERARHLLLNHDASIADVAQQVGFCDQSHLTFHFKRTHGIPPNKFLRQIGRNPTPARAAGFNPDPPPQKRTNPGTVPRIQTFSSAN